MINNIILIVIFTILGIYLIIKGSFGIFKKKTDIEIYPNRKFKIEGIDYFAVSIIYLLAGIFCLLGEIIVILLAIFNVIKIK